MSRPPKMNRLQSLMMIAIFVLIILNFNNAARLEAASGGVSGGNIAGYLEPGIASPVPRALSEAQSVELCCIASEAVAYMFTDGGRASAAADSPAGLDYSGYFSFDADLDGLDDLVVNRGGEEWMICTGGKAEIDCVMLEDGRAWLAENSASLRSEQFSFFKKTSVPTGLISLADALLERFPFVMEVQRLDLHTDGVEDYVLFLEADPDYGPRGVAFSGGAARTDGAWINCCVVLISSPDNVYVRICTVDEAQELIDGAGKAAFDSSQAGL